MNTTICSSVIDAIGYAPVVDLARLTADIDGNILAKLEYLNPGGSKKDLIARAIIQSAEDNSLLKPGQTVLELTSGNTGNGLAMVCAVKGYPFIAVMSQGNTPERAAMMRAMGATVVLVEQSDPEQGITEEDMKRVEDTATAWRSSTTLFGQTNSSAWRIHRPTTSTQVRNGYAKRMAKSMPSAISSGPAEASREWPAPSRNTIPTSVASS
jgi:cysteine synthase